MSSDFVQHQTWGRLGRVGAESPPHTRQLAQPLLPLGEDTFRLASAGSSRITFLSPDPAFPDSALSISHFLRSVRGVPPARTRLLLGGTCSLSPTGGRRVSPVSSEIATLSCSRKPCHRPLSDVLAQIRMIRMAA